MDISGNTLTSTLDRSSADKYPDRVDPTVADGELDENDPYASDWREEPAPPSPFFFKENTCNQAVMSRRETHRRIARRHRENLDAHGHSCDKQRPHGLSAGSTTGIIGHMTPGGQVTEFTIATRYSNHRRHGRRPLVH